MVKWLWRVYRNSMRTRPLVTNITTGGIVMLLGDGLAQIYESQNKQNERNEHVHDCNRALTAATWQGVIFATSFFFWFRWLDKHFPGASLRAVAAKVLINQAVVTLPINGGYIAYTVSVENMLRNMEQRKTVTEVGKEVQQRLHHGMKTIAINSCFLWLPVNFLNFLFVPVHLRVLPSVLTSVTWSTYLSITAHDTESLYEEE